MWDEVIDDIVTLVLEELGRRGRPGAYRASVSAHESLRRAQVQPVWMESSAALAGALRVAPSLLDVIEPAGMPLAIIGEDGIPERPLVLGAITDETTPPESRPAWLRSHQHEAATTGHVEMGATNGLRFKVGTNTGGLAPVNDAIISGVGTAEQRLRAAGTFAVSNTGGELVAQLVEALTAAQEIIDGLALVAAAINTANASPTTPVTNGTLFAMFAGVNVATTSAAATKIGAALVLLDTFKE